MKGLTHNLLACLKCSSFPLKVTVADAEQLDAEFDAEHVLRMLPKLDWNGLRGLQEDLKEFMEEGITPLPEEKPVDLHTNEELLRTLHHLLAEIKVVNGALQCPSDKCGVRFQIKDTIPNMVLLEG